MKNRYDYNKWKSWNWESDFRYYRLSLSQNLFKEWIIVKQWGGLKTRIQGTKTIYCDSLDDINNIFKDTSKKRIARGYELVG